MTHAAACRTHAFLFPLSPIFFGVPVIRVPPTLLALLLLSTTILPAWAGTETANGDGTSDFSEDFESFTVHSPFAPTGQFYDVTTSGQGSDGIISSPAQGSRAWNVVPSSSPTAAGMRGLRAQAIDMCQAPLGRVEASLLVADDAGMDGDPAQRLALIPYSFIPNTVGPGIFLSIDQTGTPGNDPIFVNVQLRNAAGAALDTKSLLVTGDGYTTEVFQTYRIQLHSCSGTTQATVSHVQSGKSVFLSGSVSLSEMNHLAFGSVINGSDQTDLVLDNVLFDNIPDQDQDLVPDAGDNCPTIPNQGQEDTDMDGTGDACEDSDGDGVFDDVDNCPTIPNPGQEDTDMDGTGDACADRDGDGVPDSQDNCPDNSNPSQSDFDGDGIGDACDTPFTIGGLFLGEDFEDDTLGQNSAESWYSWGQVGASGPCAATFRKVVASPALDDQALNVDTSSCPDNSRRGVQFNTDFNICDVEEVRSSFYLVGSSNPNALPNMLRLGQGSSFGTNFAFEVVYSGFADEIQFIARGASPSQQTQTLLASPSFGQWYNVTVDAIDCGDSSARACLPAFAVCVTSNAGGSFTNMAVVSFNGNNQGTGFFVDNVLLINGSISWSAFAPFTSLSGMDVDPRGQDVVIVRSEGFKVTTLTPLNLDVIATNTNSDCNRPYGVYARQWERVPATENGKFLQAHVAYLACSGGDVDQLRMRASDLETSTDTCGYCGENGNGQIDDSLATHNVPDDMLELADLSSYSINFKARDDGGFFTPARTVIVFPSLFQGDGKTGVYAIKFRNNAPDFEDVDRIQYGSPGTTIQQMCHWLDTTTKSAQHPNGRDLTVYVNESLPTRIYQYVVDEEANAASGTAGIEDLVEISLRFLVPGGSGARAVGCTHGYVALGINEELSLFTTEDPVRGSNGPQRGAKVWTIPLEVRDRGLAMTSYRGYVYGVAIGTDDRAYIFNGTSGSVTCDFPLPEGAQFKEVDIDTAMNHIWIGMTNGVYRFPSAFCTTGAEQSISDPLGNIDPYKDSDGDGMPDWIDNDPLDADCNDNGVPDGEEVVTCNGITCNNGDCAPASGDPTGTLLLNNGRCGFIDLAFFSGLLEISTVATGAIFTVILCAVLAILLLSFRAGRAGVFGGIALGAIMAYPLCLVPLLVAVLLTISCVALAVFTWRG